MVRNKLPKRVIERFGNGKNERDQITIPEDDISNILRIMMQIISYINILTLSQWIIIAKKYC